MLESIQAIQYTELAKHRMFSVNDLVSQRLLLDRRVIYDQLTVWLRPLSLAISLSPDSHAASLPCSRSLQLYGIEIPRNIWLSRDDLPSSVLASERFQAADAPVWSERRDELEVNGLKISKPFVEKPAYAEDHNVYIYYHSTDTERSGSTRLFRKACVTLCFAPCLVVVAD